MFSNRRVPGFSLWAIVLMWAVLIGVVLLRQLPAFSQPEETTSLMEELDGAIDSLTVTIKLEKADSPTIWVFNSAEEANYFSGAGLVQEGDLLVYGELDALTGSLSSLNLTSNSDAEVSDWLYRVTYYLTPEEGESYTTVFSSIGNDAMTLSGGTFTAGEGSDFSEVVDFFAGKYDYYAGLSSEQAA